jgi:lipid-A-disaccharide synthase-like uncharacterized protein
MQHDAWVISWNIVGGLGNAAFFSRFLVQWYATEKQKRVVVPAVFWWLSLAGSILLLSYAVFYDRHTVIVLAYCFTWIPYIRNLIIHHRHSKAQPSCSGCGRPCPPQTNFCPECGARLSGAGECAR